MSDARAPAGDVVGLNAFARRVAWVVFALTALMAWRLIIGLATLDIDASTMKFTQRFTGAPIARAETRAVATMVSLETAGASEPRRAGREVAEREDARGGDAEKPNEEETKDEPPKDEPPKVETPKDEPPKDETPKDEMPKAPTSNATVDDVERLRASLRAIQGMAEDIDFIESLERDANSTRNPCWTTKDGASRCLPAAYVMGAWQSGSGELGERLQSALGKDKVRARAPHFWNEHTKTLESYASTWDRDAFGVDTSPGTLATSWSESMRFHRAHGAHIEKCWKTCQELSNAYEDDADAKPSEEEDARRRGTARASPRRRCIDGTTDDPKSGCCGAANELDPFEENGGHGLSLPHLMRAAYGDAPPKFILITREPGARLHAAYNHYEHYKSRYGDDEDGFAAYAEEMMTMFTKCVESGHPLKGCANRFETYSPEFEAVFYHADALIKSMYAVFLEQWFDVFPRELFLILRAEDVWSADVATRVAAAKRALEHLGLDASDAVAEKIASTPHGNDLIPVVHDDASAMREDIRAKIDEFFAPHGLRLAELAGDDAFAYSKGGR